MQKTKTAQLIVQCLENEGVEYIFGIPGEENIDIMDALLDSSIRFILTRHEQGASFMADIYGRLTHKAGVCLATLGPGAINLLLGAADANLDSSPLVAIAAQASIDRLNKESHQVIHLENLFNPVTKWCAMLNLPGSAPEIVRKAFKQAQMERTGATAIIVPEDIAQQSTSAKPLKVAQPKPTYPNPAQIARAVDIINTAKKPLILAGYGVVRARAEAALQQLATHTQIPVATTFMAKGAISARDNLSLGTLGFMGSDYIDACFAQADIVITIGYDLVEYAPARWNPRNDKKIIHLHSITAEVDSAYTIEVGIQGDLTITLAQLMAQLTPHAHLLDDYQIARQQFQQELQRYIDDNSYPLKPQKIVADMRAALNDEDILLCDTGALKMWAARLYPCYLSNTCLISNSLATMAFSLPGAIAAKLIYPERKIIAAMGDGSFLMNSQELETAKREGTAFVVLVWRDESYGLIEWKQMIEFGRSSHIRFTNPDLVQYAESFGIRGYRIEKAGDLLPTLQKALAANELAVIDCPVDYAENMKLTAALNTLAK